MKRKSSYKNFSQPLGAQSLRLWQRLRALRRGSLAVPRQEALVGPALPLRRIAQVLPQIEKRHWRQSRHVLKASAIRASRREKFFQAESHSPDAASGRRQESEYSCRRGPVERGRLKPSSILSGSCRVTFLFSQPPPEFGIRPSFPTTTEVPVGRAAAGGEGILLRRRF